MMDDPRTGRCDRYEDGLAELALGVLTGRERAATLAHVDSCAHCAEELEQLSRAADAVVHVAPEEEPPVGFEVTLFGRMGLAESGPGASTPRRRSRARWAAAPRWALAAAAAAVALIAGLSIGWATGSSVSHPTQAVSGPHPSGREVATAELTEGGRSVGRVLTYGGSTPWMVVTLADSSIDGKVSCEVVTADGEVHKVGAFTAWEGYGAWGAPLPVAPRDVHKAEVVSSDGTVIATATLG
ncbi:MAG: anti-sigma factor family protein [Acidimicrobiales bacterium]